jgi:hypothetical protein
MTVKELIQLLEQESPYMEVMVMKSGDSSFHLTSIEEVEEIKTSVGEAYVVLYSGQIQPSSAHN